MSGESRKISDRPSFHHGRRIDRLTGADLVEAADDALEVHGVVERHSPTDAHNRAASADHDQQAQAVSRFITDMLAASIGQGNGVTTLQRRSVTTLFFNRPE